MRAVLKIPEIRQKVEERIMNDVSGFGRIQQRDTSQIPENEEDS